MMRTCVSVARLVLACAAITAFWPALSAAEALKIGGIKITVMGPLFLAQEREYFAPEGLSAELILFDQPQQLVPALIAGDLDFAVGGLTAAFFNLGQHGAIKIIGGVGMETPGFTGNAFVVSNASSNAGLKTLKDIAGHSAVMPVLGSPPHYQLGVVADKYGFDLKTVKLVQAGSFPNAISAVVGGGADVGVLPWSAVKAPLQHADMRLLASVGDEMRSQLTVMLASRSVADNKGDTVKRFLNVYRKGAADYRDAFVGPGETHREGPTAPQVSSVVAKNLGQPVELVQQGVGYVTPEGQLDVKDTLHQLAWYKSQGMVKPEIDGDDIVDKRYVVELPQQ